MQLVLLGDFFQLPPINGRFVFHSESWVAGIRNVVILDENMRHMNGSTATIELRKHEARKGEVKPQLVIATSGNSSTGDIRKYKNAGFHGMLRKPMRVKSVVTDVLDYIKFSELTNRAVWTPGDKLPPGCPSRRREAPRHLLKVTILATSRFLGAEQQGVDLREWVLCFDKVCGSLRPTQRPQRPCGVCIESRVIKKTDENILPKVWGLRKIGRAVQMSFGPPPPGRTKALELPPHSVIFIYVIHNLSPPNRREFGTWSFYPLRCFSIRVQFSQRKNKKNIASRGGRCDPRILRRSIHVSVCHDQQVRNVVERVVVVVRTHLSLSSCNQTKHSIEEDRLKSKSASSTFSLSLSDDSLLFRRRRCATTATAEQRGVSLLLREECFRFEFSKHKRTQTLE